MHDSLIINGFFVKLRLVTLMVREDWSGMHTSAVWLEKFSAAAGSQTGIRFVQFFAPDQAIKENMHVRDPGLKILLGEPRSDISPGNFDPSAGYVIGMVDYVDAPIAIDLRTQAAPRVIYDTMSPTKDAVYQTAFDQLSLFISFYLEQTSP